MTPTKTPGELFLTAAVAEFDRHKRLAERALEQLDDGDFFHKPDAESNSVYIIVKHMAGNMHSRWTDFLTTDGEKPNRNRDAEFVEETASREEVMRTWESGWQCLFDSLSGLTEADLTDTVLIRNKPSTVTEAIIRQLTHYAQHIGQIAYVGKHRRGREWKSLSIPRGKSQEFAGR